MRFVRIPNGTFKMGSANERFAEKKIENDFYLGVYEITQSQYQKVMGENPSHCQGNRVKHWSGE
ncbi:MAG: formylglycine-generating enzyme family protein [Planctomycetes bacterium]|nr:formylglycine-generating enzyme family protein [Planctomycetota bacterium]